MRTTEREQQGTVEMSAFMPDVGNATLQPGGVAAVVTRSSTGSYEVKFDTRIVPLTTQVIADGTGTSARTWSKAPGSVIWNTYTGAGVLVNSPVYLSFIALDKRT